ncbi:MAG: hypothetical protein A2091_00790 [Desulfuromonadales bacterium GWD2_61_12]|nr:MAG: hypothetical protein A2005_02200 [Desulfuromonadales bacterium GWC2_61_20]OGR36244.1 MAG: hypothetical protein A2091_00790 [Desulfuromonadales bacterium GWD2_61_12]HAD03386.1 hypothetical protein [Desulfuromonas sp.]
MKSTIIRNHFRSPWISLALLLLLTVGLASQAAAFTLEVVTRDAAGALVPMSGSGFRWLLEEDNTNQPPGFPTAGADSDSQPPAPPANKIDSAFSIGLDIHKSYAPAVATGSATGSSTIITPPDTGKRYFASVLPAGGYSLGGAPVPIGADTVRVVVVEHRAYNPAYVDMGIPTAQISVLVFEDHYAINNAPDVPNERGLEGFSIILFDAAGQQMTDAFGNMLGTTYTDDGNGNFTVDMPGTGAIRTDANGEALIKYLMPGKYGVQVIPPTVDPATGLPVNWVQTATIEGTKTIDAWVAANEPPLFIEGFGAGGKHVNFGYVNPAALPWALNPPTVDNDGITPYTGSISGTNRYNHFSKPPFLQGFFPGDPVAECWVGLNDAVTGQGLLAVPCDGDSNFALDNVPPGSYQLVTWDAPLQALFGFNAVTVPAVAAPTGDAVALGNVLSFRWFGTYEGSVFLDHDQDGFRDPCVTPACNDPLVDEIGLPEQVVNIRFRDGTLYQTQPTDVFGGFELSGVFPFFKWLVTEVDFARYKATGMTAVVDDGGEVLPDNGWAMPSRDKLTPQPQAEVNPNTGNNLSRTETGPVLTEGLMLFLNQTNTIDWGKHEYAPGENGGISGIVYSAVTRAENDPRYATGEDWEPGIPRVQVNLYQDFRTNATGVPGPDGKIDDLDRDGMETLADVDNHPFGNFPGVEDIDRNGNGLFNPGDAIQIATSDSWDDNLPSGCLQTLPVIDGQTARECFDNFGTWNQVRPAVFDGGFAFNSYFPEGIFKGRPEVEGLPAGTYIVEAANPRPGVYLLQKEEDKNVDFGETPIPSPLLLPQVCVGDPHLVPTELALFPGVAIDPPLGGSTQPLCDRKQVELSDANNTGVNFFYFTEVPKAARVVGFVNNDLAAEFDPTSPIFGEKAAPMWIPVSFRDWQGNEITRVYTDAYGAYNALLPSTFSINVPSPSGVAPNMITAVLNDPGPIPDPSNPGQMIIDPNYDERFAVAPWTLHYEVGRTTYLDTPIVPVAAFATIPKGTLDTGVPAGTPVVASVIGNNNSAAICTDLPETTLTISAAVAADGRDNGFGDVEGQILIDGSAAGITIAGWSATVITVTVDSGVTVSGVLSVVRGDNARPSENGVGVAIVDCSAPSVHSITGGSVYPYVGGSIQAAIDAAAPGDLILVGPGSYFENVIMWKPVRLQGAGSGVTRIFANPNPAERLQAWHSKTRDLLGTPDGDPNPFLANEAPGILVFNAPSALIDGFEISGALSGGGIDVNNDSPGLQISNNVLRSNQGNWGGGIVVGVPDTGVASGNTDLIIRDNRISANSGVLGPGGIAIYGGSDSYLIESNRIAGNFSRDSGGGVGHVGLSDGGVIRANQILFNEVFYGLLVPGGGHGGGIFVSGDVPPPPAVQISGGAGDVTIEGNLVQGNLAGAGNGGGIAAYAFNGDDVANNPATPGAWDTLTIRNNMIVNNVAAIGGGGISLQDVAAGNIVHNTVARNDSTATAALAFNAGNLTFSVPQGAGIVSSAHSQSLRNIGGGFSQTYADPTLVNNIVWQNRSFYNDSTINGTAGGLVPASQHQAAEAAYALTHPGYVPDTTAYADFADLAVAGALDPGDVLHPTFSILTDSTAYPGNNNMAQDPGVVQSYYNDLQSSTVLDEGGNAITVRFTPLTTEAGDYHLLTACSPAVDGGSNAGVTSDIDGANRPNGSAFDIGADEYDSASEPAPGNVLALLYPNGGEALTAGTNLIVRWAGLAGAATYDLGYSLSPGSPFRLIATGVTGTCSSVPIAPEIAGSNVRLGVIARDGAGAVLARDLTDGALSIVVEALLSPNGGEVLIGGNTATVTWTSRYAPAPVNRVALWYQTAASAPWTAIGVTSDSGRFDWTVPSLPTTVATVRVALAFYGADGKQLVSDLSAAPFTIVANPPAVPAATLQSAPAAAVAPTGLGAASLTFLGSIDSTPTAVAPAVELLVPGGGEVFAAGERIPLLWSSPPNDKPVAGVEIGFSGDGGATWQLVGRLASDTGYLLWTVPALTDASDKGLIEIRRLDTFDGVIDRDRNDTPFAIAAPAN